MSAADLAQPKPVIEPGPEKWREFVPSDEEIEELLRPKVELVETDPLSARKAVFALHDWRLVEDGSIGPFDHEVFRIVRPYIEGRKRNANVTLVRQVNYLPTPAVNPGTE